jgi:hypothetical protein
MRKANIVLPPVLKLNFDSGYKFYPEVGLFSKPDRIKHSSLEISFYDTELIVSKINQYIDTFEGLKILQYEPHQKQWVIEYGTNRIERILKALNWESEYYFKLNDSLTCIENSLEKYKSNRLIERKIGAKKWWAQQATFKAQDKFESTINLDDDDDYDINLKWTKFTIALFYDKDKNNIIIEFQNPFCDIDDLTFYYFRQEIFKLLQNTA